MRVVISGGHTVGGELARKLLNQNHDVIVIDKDKERCDKLYSEIGVVAIEGNSAEAGTLEEAEINKADLFVATHANDADNLASAILAKSFGVSQIIVRMHNPAYEKAYRLAGVDSMVRGTDLMVNHILMEIEYPRALNLSTIGEGKANIFMVVIPENAKINRKTIMEIAQNPRFPSECIIIAVYNKDKQEFSIPRGNKVIYSGDELFLISTEENNKQIIDFLTTQKKGLLRRKNAKS